MQSELALYHESVKVLLWKKHAEPSPLQTSVVLFSNKGAHEGGMGGGGEASTGGSGGGLGGGLQGNW